MKDVVSLPRAFSRLRHLARLFWNQTCNKETGHVSKTLLYAKGGSV